MGKINVFEIFFNYPSDRSLNMEPSEVRISLKNHPSPPVSTGITSRWIKVRFAIFFII